MKGVKEFNIPKEKALKAWKEYLELLKNRDDEGAKVLKEAYYHASKGRKIIDIYQAMQNAGVNKDGWPQLAICRADGKEGMFRRRAKGAGLFHHEHLRRWDTGTRFSVLLPEGCFMDLPVDEWNREKDQRYATIPTIPAKYYPKGKLEKYYILWEVEEWYEKSQIPVPPIDPFLLKRLSPNLFVVLAEWDLTPLERAVIKGAVTF